MEITKNKKFDLCKNNKPKFTWEMFLLFLFVLVNVFNISFSKNYLSVNNLFTTICTFIPKGIIAFAMTYLLILGEIDLSVGGIITLSATTLAYMFNNDVPLEIAVILCLLVGLICGVINGLILWKFDELPSMIVTMATQLVYRGIAEILLKNDSVGKLHLVDWFYDIYYGKIFNIPVCFIVFLILALVFAFILHKTTFGRKMYAIGINKVASKYAGISVKMTKLICFSLVGLNCGIAAIYYASWMGSIRSDIAVGYDLEVISMAVLGGVSTNGGTGSFLGVLIAIFIIGLLKYGLGLINIDSQIIMMIIGIILIVVNFLPNIGGKFYEKNNS